MPYVYKISSKYSVSPCDMTHGGHAASVLNKGCPVSLSTRLTRASFTAN